MSAGWGAKDKWEATTVGREERGEVGVEVERAVRARARPAVVNLRRGANVMQLGQSQRMCKIVCKMLRTIVLSTIASRCLRTCWPSFGHLALAS